MNDRSVYRLAPLDGRRVDMNCVGQGRRWRGDALDGGHAAQRDSRHVLAWASRVLFSLFHGIGALPFEAINERAARRANDDDTRRQSTSRPLDCAGCMTPRAKLARSSISSYPFRRLARRWARRGIGGIDAITSAGCAALGLQRTPARRRWSEPLATRGHVCDSVMPGPVMMTTLPWPSRQRCVGWICYARPVKTLVERMPAWDAVNGAPAAAIVRAMASRGADRLAVDSSKSSLATSA